MNAYARSPSATVREAMCDLAGSFFNARVGDPIPNTDRTYDMEDALHEAARLVTTCYSGRLQLYLDAAAEQLRVTPVQMQTL